MHERACMIPVVKNGNILTFLGQKYEFQVILKPRESDSHTPVLLDL